MTNYVATLMHLIPDAKLSYRGSVVQYEDITWMDSRTQPSKADCDAAWPQVEFELETARIALERKRRYENETDGLFFDAMRTNQSLDSWKLAVEKIKSDLPYPEEVA